MPSARVAQNLLLRLTSFIYTRSIIHVARSFSKMIRVGPDLNSIMYSMILHHCKIDTFCAMSSPPKKRSRKRLQVASTSQPATSCYLRDITIHPIQAAKACPRKRARPPSSVFVNRPLSRKTPLQSRVRLDTQTVVMCYLVTLCRRVASDSWRHPWQLLSIPLYLWRIVSCC